MPIKSLIQLLFFMQSAHLTSYIFVLFIVDKHSFPMPNIINCVNLPRMSCNWGEFYKSFVVIMCLYTTYTGLLLNLHVLVYKYQSLNKILVLRTNIYGFGPKKTLVYHAVRKWLKGCVITSSENKYIVLFRLSLPTPLQSIFRLLTSL